jgi:hypothetical protein
VWFQASSNSRELQALSLAVLILETALVAPEVELVP